MPEGSKNARRLTCQLNQQLLHLLVQSSRYGIGKQLKPPIDSTPGGMLDLSHDGEIHNCWKKRKQDFRIVKPTCFTYMLFPE